MASHEDGDDVAAGFVERRHNPGDSRTVIALAERVAVVETQQHALKEDTTAIRRSMHEFSNQLQIFVGGLAALQKVAEDFPKIAELVDVFAKEQQRRKGAWGAAVLFGTMLMGAVTLGGGIVTTGWYLLHMK